MKRVSARNACNMQTCKGWKDAPIFIKRVFAEQQRQYSSNATSFREERDKRLAGDLFICFKPVRPIVGKVPHKKVQYENVCISVLEKTQKYLCLHFLTAVMPHKKNGGCRPRPSLFAGFSCIIDLNFELEPVSVQFLQVSPDYVVILCTHGHRSYFPAFEQI